MRHAGLVVLGLIGLVSAYPACAQPDPSEAEIIEGLKPTKQGLTDHGRGIVPALTDTDNTTAAGTHGTGTHGTGTHGTGSTGTGGSGRAKISQGAKSIWLSIDFVTGSAALSPHAVVQLETLGHALNASELVHDRFRIEGHTDTVGTLDYNKDLSVRRAQAVAAYLEQNAGVDARRLTPIGLGEAELIVQTPDQTAEARNRRVRIVNLGS